MVDNLEEVQISTYNKPAIPKIQRNTNAQIMVLPDDILAEIFLTLKNGIYVESVQSWYPITQVCRHWRHVALGLANLWTKPPTRHHDLTCLMLKRSRTSLLNISISPLTSNATYTAILSHIGRIRVLNVEQYREGLEHIQRILSVSKHEASHLTTLNITQYTMSSNRPFRLSIPTLRRLPSLKTIRLTSIDFDWDIFPIRGLTSLSLDCISFSNPPSWTQFQQALGEMPLLEYLTIGLSRLKLSAPSGPLEGLDLPLLRRIEIQECHMSDVQSLLRKASLPRLRNVYLGCLLNMSSDLDEYPTTVDTVLSLIPKGNFDRLDNLVIQYGVFNLFSGSSFGLSRADRCSIDLIAYNRDSDVMVGLTRALMTGLAAASSDLTSEITHMCLAQDLTSEQILELFGPLPQLKFFQLGYARPQQIIKSLQISPLHPPGSPIPFSKLKILRFNGPYRADEHTLELLEELRLGLAQRYRCGAAITSLVVRWNLDRDSEEARCLQKLISDVKKGRPLSSIGSD